MANDPSNKAPAMKVPEVSTPLSVIAIFVALIELFLAYPVTQLQGTERLIVVIFMTAFPFFVASAFFYILWYKPIHLYRPQDITPGLEDRYQTDVKKQAALEADNEDLREEIERLRHRSMPADAALVSPTAAFRFAQELRPLTPAEAVGTEAQVSVHVAPAAAGGPLAVEQAKQAIRRSRREGKQQKAKKIRDEMSKFRDWLAGLGFDNLPAIPEIVIEPPDVLNAYYVSTDKTAHFGAAVADDSDTIAHTYFHTVLNALGVLTEFEGETAALVEGLCDYFPCSYNDDPYLGEKFAMALVKRMGEAEAREAGLHPEYLRNLADVVTPQQTGSEPHAMGLVWSGACWELRKHFGAREFDKALRMTLPKLGARTTLSAAAQALQLELANVLGKDVRAEVEKVFQKRGIKVAAAGP
jgi:hypothetical protein